MTLDTRVIIKRPVSVQQVFDFCNRELLKVTDPKSAHEPGWDPKTMRMHNALGQGLAAILDITYCPDGPHTASYMVPDEDWETGPAGPELLEMLTGSMEVSFDTAYGYGRHSPVKAACGDLHAYFVHRLAQEFGPVVWLDECGGEWYWLDLEAPGNQIMDQLMLVQEKLGNPAMGRMDRDATPMKGKTKVEPWSGGAQ